MIERRARPRRPSSPKTRELPADVPSAPEGWQVLRTEGLGPFTSRVVFRRPDGVEVEWTSRRHRKDQGLGPVTGPDGGVVEPARAGRLVELRRVPVARRTWWMAGLFSVGSLCFAIGALPAFAQRVSGRADGLVLFAGSIFFTAASYLAFAEVTNRPDEVSGPGEGAPAHRRPFSLLRFRPRSIDWWSTAVQLVGTVYFNVMTFMALHEGWSTQQLRRAVWRPDVIGSICFLVASYLAWVEVCGNLGRLRFRDVSWWVVALNLLGSIAFGVSAVGASVLRDGDVLSARMDYGGTVAGAVCFLVAAVLLVPEARLARKPISASTPTKA